MQVIEASFDAAPHILRTEARFSIFPVDEAIITLPDDTTQKLETGRYRIDPDGMITDEDKNAVRPEPKSRLVVRGSLTYDRVYDYTF